ncbi:MAG: hypothetical protein ACO3Z6_05680 [Pseudomonadales bacterium]|jgi:hypothetical protein
MTPRPETRRFEPTRSQLLWAGSVLAGLIIADFSVTHGHTGLAGQPGVHALIGLGAGFASIGIAKLLKALLKRPDSYYE